ncbi:MAG: trigger factor [candidate division WOR-3 bacterium]
MKLEKTLQDDHQARIVVEVEAQQFEAAKRQAVRRLSERDPIPGFRPGKAPYELVRRHYGDRAIYEEAVDLLLDDLYPKILKEAQIEPAAPGVLESIEDQEPPRLILRVPLAPEVELSDYHEIRLPYEFTPPGPEKTMVVLERLRRAFASTQTVEREAQEGDFVLVDLKSDNPSLTRSNFGVVIEAEQEDEFPFPGFARQLLGMKAGETKTVHHTFPQDYKEDQNLAGQSVTIEVSIKAVHALTLPELNDDFAKMVGNYDSLDALKAELSGRIEAYERARYDDEYYTKLIDLLRERATVKYAPQTVKEEAEQVMEELKQRLAEEDLDLETFYKTQNITAERFFEEVATPIARERLEHMLIMDEVSRREGIKIDKTSLEREIAHTLEHLQMHGVDLDSLLKTSPKQERRSLNRALMLESTQRLITQRTLERLKAIATGEYNPPTPSNGNVST